jgi:hypothetical protein
MATSFAYEPDTVVVDEPQRGRVQTEELTMQVLHAGHWHRRLPDLSATSCGARYPSQFAPLRREALRHPLCGGCFTPLELARADRLDLESDQ